MATANYCNQQSDYVSKILTEKRKVSPVLLRFSKNIVIIYLDLYSPS